MTPRIDVCVCVYSRLIESVSKIDPGAELKSFITLPTGQKEHY